jgi:hypothetical protein
MKRILATMAVILALTASGAWAAQDNGNRKTAGFGISLPIAAFNHKPGERSVNVGLSAAGFYSFTNRFWIEGELSTWAREEVLEDYNFKLRSYMAAINVDLFHFKKTRLTPYVGTGLFLLQNGSGSAESELYYQYYGYFEWEYAPGVLVGGGLRWQFIDKVGFRLDIRDQIGMKTWGHESNRHFIRTALSVVISSSQQRTHR